MNRKAYIPISALLGALLLALVAAMTPFVAGPDRAHAQTAASITVGGERITIGAEFEYTGPRVSSGTSHIQVSAAAEPGSRVHSIRYASDITASSGEGVVTAADFATLAGTAAPGGRVPLRANKSTDIGVVMATGTGDSMRGTIYVVTVTRVSSTANKDADLSALAVTGIPSGVSIVPDFDSDTTSYSLFVPYDVADDGGTVGDEITITATRSDDNTQTTTQGSAVTITSDKDDSIIDNVVELAEGQNVIRIMVEAANVVTKKTYTLTVRRAAANSSDDASLASLMVGGKSVPAANIELADGVGTDVDYTTKFPFATESVQVTAVKNHPGAQVVIRTGADAATAASASGVIDPDGRLDLVAGTPLFIAVQVSAEDGKSASRRNYILSVTRVASAASSDANLSALSISAPTGINLAPAFAADTTSYTAFTQYDVDGDSATGTASDDEITITATAVDTTNGTVTITSDKDSEIGDDNVVELAVGRNVITVMVEAADVVTTKTYTITVTRATETGSDDTSLSALMVDGESVSVAGFDGTDTTVDYTTNVPTTVRRIVITATPTDSAAVVLIRTGADAATAASASGVIDPDGRLDLVAGTPLFIAVQVTAADGSTTSNYILSVTRAVATASDNANLTALSISAPTGITLAPTFDEDVTSYMASVPYDVDANADSPTAGTQDEITLTVTQATGATFKVTSDMDDSIGTDNVVELAEGANVITIMVEAANAVATKTYTVTVTRAAMNASDDASLSALMVGSDTVSLPLPAYDASAAATIYVGGVPNAVNSIQIAATPTHAGATAVVRAVTAVGDVPTAEEAAAGTIDADGNIPLVIGYGNFIAVQVMAEDGLSASNRTYMLQVNRAPAGASNDAKLTETPVGLKITAGSTLMLDFDPDTMAYTAEVDNGVGSVSVTATGFEATDAATTQNRATVRIMSDTDSDIGNDSGAGLHVATHSIDLEVGANVITIMVTAADYSAMNTYTVTITRAAAGDDATLSSLSLKHLPMNMMEGMAIELTDMDGMAMAFDSADTMYYANAGDADEITVTAMAAHPEAMVSVMVGGNMAMMTDVAAYWDMLGCPAMNDAVGADDQPDDATSPYCKMYAGLDMDAKAVVDAAFANYYSVPLETGDNTVTVMVTSEDETTTMTYTVMVSTGPTTGGDLLDRYDADDSGHIDLSEVSAAIDDYFNGDLTLAEVSLVIDLYFM